MPTYYYALIIPSIIAFYIALVNICKRKYSVPELILSFSAIYIVAALTMAIFGSIFPAFGIDMPTNIAITACLFVFVYREIKIKLLSGFYALSSSVTTMISGSISGAFINNIFDIYVRDLDSFFLYFMNLLLLYLICYVLSKHIGNHLHKCYVQLSLEVRQKFAAYGFLLSVLTYSLSHVNVFAYRMIDDRVLLSTINAVLITTIFFVAIIMLAAYSLSQQKQAEAMLKTEAEKSLAEHTVQLESAYKDMRKFRHDYHNLLSTLIAYNDINALKKHLAKYLNYADEALKTLDSASVRLNMINIPELKSLLAIKCAQAQAQGITLDVNITEPVYNIPLNTVDLCRMIGIMTDNAIEELTDDEHDTKIFKFSIVVDEAETIIICSNPYRTAPLIRKIFDEGYSTKGPGRGMGLSIFKQYCKNNKNLLYSINMENNEFAIILSIRQV